MEVSVCSACLQNKTALKCSHCEKPSCKSCSIFIDESQFEYLFLLPDNIRDNTFCPNCYNEHVDETLEAARETLLKAKDVDVFIKEQGSETRRIRRIQKPIKVSDCESREDVLLCLAFLAVQKGFSTILDVEIKTKVLEKGGSYKKAVYDGTAVPVDPNIRR